MLEKQLFELTKKTITIDGGFKKICFEGVANCVCTGFVLENCNDICEIAFPSKYRSIGTFEAQDVFGFDIDNIQSPSAIDGGFILENPVLLSEKKVKITIRITSTKTIDLPKAYIEGYKLPRFMHFVGPTNVMNLQHIPTLEAGLNPAKEEKCSGEVQKLHKPILVKFSFEETDKGMVTLNGTFIINGATESVLIATKTSLSITPEIPITPMLEVLGLTEYPLEEVLFELPNLGTCCAISGSIFDIGFLHKTINLSIPVDKRVLDGIKASVPKRDDD